MPADAELVETILESPAGVAVLACAEAWASDRPPWEPATSTSLDGVARAADLVSTGDEGALLELVVEAAHAIAGPWRSNAPDDLAEAYRRADERRPIAAELARRIVALPRDATTNQELWLDDRRLDPGTTTPKFVDLSVVYGNGEFTFGGLWTVTAPPSRIAEVLASVWEMYPGPISRWRLPVRDDARVHGVDGPEDWADLVMRYPRIAPGLHSGWELPGPNQHIGEIAGVVAVPGQRAARSVIGPHLLPDWDAVREDLDGVHLSWRGFITCEGRIVDLPDGAVTMLRYWGSERTLWLRDVFGDPEPLDLPLLLGDSNEADGVGELPDASRLARDGRMVAHLLGRK